jgi:hypothetical protein
MHKAMAKCPVSAAYHFASRESPTQMKGLSVIIENPFVVEVLFEGERKKKKTSKSNK